MNKRNIIRTLLYLPVIAMICVCPKDASAQQAKPAIGTIIIDAGHGGVDPGAKGQLSTEAEIALSIALKLGKAMAEQMPDVKLVYTRTTDDLPGGGTDIHDALRVRAEMANQARGDLFISIHCNAA